MNKSNKKQYKRKIAGIAIAISLLILLVIGCEKVGFPALNRDKCVGCGECLNSCRYDAIHFEQGKPVIDPNKCTDCGECVNACPTDALIMQ